MPNTDYDKLKARGICIRCRKNRTIKFAHCKECRIKLAEYAKKRYVPMEK